VDVIDWQALRDNCAGDDALVGEIVELFRREAPGLLADVERAVGTKEPLAIKRTAHRLKGALVSLAAPQASMLARDLEQAGTENDLSRVGALGAALAHEMTRLLAALEQSPPLAATG
jgi:HPt (histidine-containing phosphotransfer) domain-containing protein